MAKRVLDVVLSGVMLLLSAPLWPLIAISIVVDSGRPVFYRSERVGRDGDVFGMLKFRTMVSGTDGPRITGASDVRITRVGRFLRNWKLDELPQLINVLQGEMSLVGPRPEDPRYVALYSAEQRDVLTLRPGLTSPAAIEYRHEEKLMRERNDVENVYLTSIMPEKLALDLEYVRTRSTVGDLAILARSIRSLFSSSRDGP
jgi:lipopolysaccharide/colanic/teichoic acid biosynthesis glycosyltransferase